MSLLDVFRGNSYIQQSDLSNSSIPYNANQSVFLRPQAMPRFVESTERPVLEANNLRVVRVHKEVSLSLRMGDRIGVVGKSGTGKSQLLRSLIGLEQTNIENLRFKGKPIVGSDDNDSEEHSAGGITDFRSKVILVSQNRVNLEGTPRELFQDILRFRNQKHRNQRGTILLETPMLIAKSWGLDEKVFDQQWTTLSGGESQRVSLAIALALRPEVLLLDESTSALDDETSQAVEKTLINTGIPMVVITHSKDQLDRFCTHKMELL